MYLQSSYSCDTGISFNVRSTVNTTCLVFIINQAATCFDRILQSSSGRYKNHKEKLFYYLYYYELIN
jgi:hypothetical protein